MTNENPEGKGHLIIVGGTKGIGRAFRNLAGPQCRRVTVVARERPPEILEEDTRMKFVPVDVRDIGALQAGLAGAVEADGPVDGLVFFQRYRGRDDSWEGNLSVSLDATRAAITTLRDKFAPDGPKSIVVISSIASRWIADEQDEGYHVAKAGLSALTRYYAFALGPLGIRVNAVSPGTVLKEESKDYFLGNPELSELYRQVIPLRRMGTADEVAKVVQFLLSDSASFITGQEITVDGGAGLQWPESLARRLRQI